MKKEHNSDKRHKEFQFGQNPMQMTEFEKKCVMKEQLERVLAKQSYILGIQGQDGGHRHALKSEFNDKIEVEIEDHEED